MHFNDIENRNLTANGEPLVADPGNLVSTAPDNGPNPGDTVTFTYQGGGLVMSVNGQQINGGKPRRQVSLEIEVAAFTSCLGNLRRA